MFTVKGWTVDSKLLKAQTVPIVAKNATNDDQVAEKQSRKRKRNRQESQADHNDDIRQGVTKSSDQTLSKANNVKDAHARGINGGDSKSFKQKSAAIDKQDENPRRDHKPDHGTAQAITKDAAPRSKAARKGKSESSKTTTILDSKDSSTSDRSSNAHVSLVKKPSLTPMQAAMRQKLTSARFRHLNETLYTTPSQDAQALFNSNPDMFEDYHAGFRQQVAVWPENPVDKILAKLRARGSVKLQNQKKAFKSRGKHDLEQSPQDSQALPRTHGTCIVVDCGCGDARLAHTLTSSNDLQRLNMEISSYDLHSPSKLVTKADIANLPLADGSVDIVVFCLALMGTNWISFIEEAYRVLHWKGELWISEIKSRFSRPNKSGRVVEHSVGNKRNKSALSKSQAAARKADEEAAEDEVLQKEVDGAKQKAAVDTDIQGFVEVLQGRGFLLKEGASAVDDSNKMFVSMEFVKSAAPTKGKGASNETPIASKKRFQATKADISEEDDARTLKPCLYKLR